MSGGDASTSGDGPNIVELEPRLSDKERAQQIKLAMLDVLTPVMAQLDAARTDGFIVEFNIGIGPLNKNVVNVLKVSKEF